MTDTNAEPLLAIFGEKNNIKILEVSYLFILLISVNKGAIQKKKIHASEWTSAKLQDGQLEPGKRKKKHQTHTVITKSQIDSLRVICLLVKTKVTFMKKLYHR